METKSWKIECSDGMHEISVTRSDRTQPVCIYVDGNRVGEKKFDGGVFPRVEYKFTCGGDEITLIVFATQMDIVHKGRFVDKKTLYMESGKVQPWQYILFAALNILIPISTLGGIVSVICAILGTLLSALVLTSPFYSKKQKILIPILLFAVLMLVAHAFVWGLALLIS